jgi:cell division initiation protein
METRALLDGLTKLIYTWPLLVAGAVVFLGILLLLLGRQFTSGRVEPLLSDTAEPGAPRLEDIPLRIPELLSPEIRRALSAIEIPPPPPDPRQEGEPSPPPEPPRWRMRPEDVRARTFRRRLRGYDPQEVYEYLVAVSDELGTLQQRALEFRQEGQGLQAELGRWRGHAEKVQSTLATAQKLGEEMIASARKEAAQEGDRLVKDALERLVRLQQEVGRLEQERSRIREEIRRDAVAYAAALRDLEADSILLARVGGPGRIGSGPQEPPGP